MEFIINKVNYLNRYVHPQNNYFPMKLRVQIREIFSLFSSKVQNIILSLISRDFIQIPNVIIKINFIYKCVYGLKQVFSQICDWSLHSSMAVSRLLYALGFYWKPFLPKYSIIQTSLLFPNWAKLMRFFYRYCCVKVNAN